MPTIEITFGARVSGTWICTCRSIENVNASLRLGVDRRQPGVEAVGVAGGVRPVQGEDRRRHDLGLVDARVQRVLAGAQRLGPDALVPGLDDRPELELLARGVLGRQADVGLDDGDLALAHDEHLAQLDVHEERVEQVRAVEQRVVLQADAPAVGEERLVVLVVVVEVVLRAQHGLDDRHGRAAVGLHRRDVAERADAAGDVARRRALQRGDDADDVAVALRRDVHDPQRLLVDGLHGPVGGLRDHLAEDAVAGDDDEADRVDRQRRARGQHRALHAALAAVLEERADAAEVAELGLVDGRLGAGRQRAADLGDDEADAVGRHLHPVEALDAVDRPELDAQAGHQQVGLVAGLALEGDELLLAELGAEALGHQADLRRPDAVQALQHHEQHEQGDDADQDQHRGHGVMPPWHGAGLRGSSGERGEPLMTARLANRLMAPSVA